MFRKKVIFIVSGLGLALAFAASRIHVIELGYAVTRLEAEVEKMRQTNGILKTELANALSTGRLVQLAEKNRMGPPAKEQILFMPQENR